MNWFQNKFGQQPEEKSSERPPGGALAKRYGDNLRDPDALIHRANKRATGGDIEGAFSDFDSAIELSPARATAFYNRGFLHNTLGSFEAAVEDFNRALDLLPDYDEAYYQRGNSYLQLQNFPAAIQDFSRAIHLNPYSIKSYYKRAEAYAESEDTSGALADYNQVVARIPKDANAYYQRGQFLAKNGDFQTAIEDLSLAIGHNPRHADAYCSRGCCYAELGDLKRASEDFNQALLHNPSHQAAYYQRQYSLGIVNEADVLRLRTPSLPPVEPLPSSPTIAPLEVSAELVDPSVPMVGAEAHPPTLKLEPDSLRGYFERASKRALTGDVSGAIADYTKIIEQDPHNTQAYYQRGQNYSALGQNDAALDDLNQAIHWARVYSLGQLKDFSGAITETIQALKTELKKPKPSATSPSAPSLSLEEAIAAQTRIISANPDSPDAYFKRAQSRALIGDIQGAIADYSETIRLNPEHSEAYYRRALHRSALGDAAGATQDFNQAIRHKPNQSLTATGTPSGSLTVETSRNAVVNLNPGNYCTHSGNSPTARFCIFCGEPLTPRSSGLYPQTSDKPGSDASGELNTGVGTVSSSTSPTTGANAANVATNVATNLKAARPKLSLIHKLSETASPPTDLSLEFTENPVLSEAEALFQLGRTRCTGGNLKDGLNDLGHALQLFLEQRNTPRYLETLQIIQQFSQNLS
ncbi:MAG: tetratricopeptide repeat protein [Thermosynechococcaceae cyanobacterium MS004]|nr:tetratricopeptide repeat protein [Thermosynechococcaceae cyanobacterium MS004]